MDTERIRDFAEIVNRKKKEALVKMVVQGGLYPNHAKARAAPIASLRAALVTLQAAGVFELSSSVVDDDEAAQAAYAASLDADL